MKDQPIEQAKPEPPCGPWYKEPFMWLVLGLPATVVVAGFATLYIASSNPETLVNAPHSKIGFTVEKLAPQAEGAPSSN